MGKRKEITGKDNGKQKMWIMITVIIVFFAMAGYAGMSYYYSDRFFRGTTINGINCSGKTSEEAEQAVAKKAEDYLLEVKARNLKSQSINGKLIGYRYVSDGSISQYLDEQKPYKWVRGFWKKQNYTAKENMTYDKVKLKEQMEKLECVKKENQTAPEDAYVAYKDSKFEIVPETEGNTLDFNGAYQALSEAVTDKKRTIDLNSCPAVYVKAAVMKDDPDLKNSLEECQNLIRTKIVYIFGEETVTLEGDEIRNWLIFDERGQLQKNEDKLRQCVAEYVAKLAATHDTVNTEREFCTTSGRTVPVDSRLNRNIAVCGSQGSMKSRAFARVMALQCVRRGESMYITDPKSELYEDLCAYLKEEGYVVKQLNLIQLTHSDAWNCLAEIEDGELIDVFCDVVIRNTTDKFDHFYDNVEMDLLKALCLYVFEEYPQEQKTFPEAYKLLLNKSVEMLDSIFERLPTDHPAKGPYQLFSKAEKVKGNAVLGLGTRLQILQNKMVQQITSHTDIDLSLPGKQKCAYFCITSDQDSTYDMLATLFTSFLSIKLVRLADRTEKAIMKGERALGKKLEEKMDGGCDGFCSVLHYALADGSFCSIRR